MTKFIPLALALSLLAGCSQHNELEDAMENMGDAYKAMKDSSSAADIKAQLETFKAGITVASTQKVRLEDQATFDEGLEKLNMIVIGIDTALLANDLDTAKTLLEKLGETRKKYHKELGVKKK